MDYTYDIENRLTGIIADANSNCPGGNYVFDAANTNDIDGLGRLKFATETITAPNHFAYHASFSKNSAVLL